MKRTRKSAVLAIALAALLPILSWAASYHYVRNPSGLQTVAARRANIVGWEIWNGTSAIMFVQVFDVRNASQVTLGTTDPDFVIAIPAGATYARTLPVESRVAMSRGLIYAATTEDDNDTAPSYGTGTDTGSVTFFYE